MKTHILLGTLLPAFAALAQNGARPVNDGVSNTILISEKNQVTITEPGNPLGCSIKIDPKTGAFSGKIKPPGSTKFINFYGVMHQGAYNHGLGFFPGDQRAGEVVIADF